MSLLLAPKSQNRKVFIEDVCLFKKEVFKNLPVQNTGWTGPG